MNPEGVTRTPVERRTVRGMAQYFTTPFPYFFCGRFCEATFLTVLRAVCSEQDLRSHPRASFLSLSLLSFGFCFFLSYLQSVTCFLQIVEFECFSGSTCKTLSQKVCCCALSKYKLDDHACAGCVSSLLGTHTIFPILFDIVRVKSENIIKRIVVW